jgi:NADPH:quinone reductase-like Zn-dependent oxidoreductase
MGIVKAAGADAVATYDIDDMTAVVRALRASGVNVVIDTVGGSVLEKAMCLCAQRGRVCLVGATGGSTALASTMPILQQELSLHGVSLGAYLQRDQDAFAQDVAFLFSLLQSGQLKFNVQSVLPFRDARYAFDLIRTRRNAGKTVLMAPAASR